MAFVGISQGLISEVRSKINGMQRAELRSLGSDPRDNLIINGDEPWFVDKAWQGNANLISVMPKRWLSQCDQFDLSVKLNWSGSYDELGYDKGDQMYVGRVALKSKPYLPPDARGYSPTLYFGFKSDETIPTELTDSINYLLKWREIEARWEKVEVQVRDFLDNCKSLNEALKLWPDLSVYIPKHYIERIEKKANRSTTETKSSAEEVLAKINTQEIQAAAVIARLSGA